MNVTAIIVTYNSAATIRRCLLSLWSAGINDIVVVDNHSEDTTAREVMQLGVAPLVMPENQGFAAACNVGASYARSPYLLFINPDAELHRAAPARILHLFQTQQSVGAVGCRLLSPAGQPEPSNYGYSVTPLELLWRHLRHAAISRTATTNPFPVGWVSGAALWIRRTAFTAINGFDTSFFMYWEDVDLCRRLAAEQWQIMIDPSALAIHQRGVSLSSNKQRTHLYDAAADRYFQKHYSAPVWYIQRMSRRLWRRFSPQVQ